MPHISVCVPTYKRPRLLGRCLESVQNQHSDGFSFSILVVDNDINTSASEIVRQRQHRSPVELHYEVEPVQSISLARNRAIEDSQGDLVAFIDDDEFPEPTWLLELYRTYKRFGVDGVLGPVVPYFEGTPPRWLVKSGLCVRSSFATGMVLSASKYMRTGNVLLRRHILSGQDPPFDPRFGLTGGEDADFFARMLREGRSFVWCNDARVFEAVPLERQRRSYYVRRALIRGVTEADTEPALSLGTVKSLVAVVLYSASLPFLLLLGHHLFMKFLVSDCDHLAKLLAHAGIRLVHARTF